MAVEIERKFLLKNDSWREHIERSIPLKQGYLSTTPERTVRIRTKGEQGILTVKGATEGVSRVEFEYEVPLADALAMLQLCENAPIEKVRHLVHYQGHLWEIDEFEGSNAGLVVAEIELASEEEKFALPDWIGEEVSDDPRYYNASLSSRPFTRW